MARLSPETISNLPHTVQRPAYNRDGVGIGIVHLGVGAFHRAHQAVYTDEVIAKHGGDWGISGVSLQSPKVHDSLAPQDCLYTVAERGADTQNLRIIGALKEVLVATENPEAVLARIADPKTHIVSMTITEKGYLRDGASGDSGALLVDHPDIKHDLANPNSPRTMHGFVAGALNRRRQNGAGGLTLLSCDNLPANGKALKQVVLDFAKLLDEDLARWIEQNVTFPSTMVDRIVPATTDDDIKKISKTLGLDDMAPVVCEPFIQWAVEDDFAGPRPPWEDVGVQIVADVAPFEEMKLRLLNASHSALAYLGYLGGFEFIHQAMKNESYANFVRAMMDDEITPTLQIPVGTDVETYKNKLIERFKNPNLHHATWQIAMDGSQKIPQRLLQTIRARIKSNCSYDRLALPVAAWMRFVSGMDESGKAIDVRDPMSGRFKAIAGAENHAGDVAGYVSAMLGVREVFGDDLLLNNDFRETVTSALQSLYNNGARATVENFKKG